ncbi:hypothetical protein SAMN05444392_1196 [Seinonella peptonophila]|uniref:Uncharacterized protein n=1 Tax=Seinonella peptonophila TaxID=112248 RepID=A0A1M5B764_9BACL|nr:hypothetical protein [Seinonella peptonophila]SHF38260.1 hypothetical protein SAMN05444392_1196 [Seinonella peptonophila]
MEIVFFVLYGLLIWIAIYIMQRDIKNKSFVLIGISLIFSAISNGGMILASYTITFRSIFVSICDFCIFYSPLILIGAIYAQLPQSSKYRTRMIQLWCYVLLPLVSVVSIYLFYLHNIYSLQVVLFSFILIAFVLTIIISMKSFITHLKDKITKFSLLLCIFIYVVSLIMLLFNDHAIFSILNSIGLIGIAIIMFASMVLKQGERWFPDFIYSFDYMLLITLVFTGQVVFVIWISSRFSFNTILFILISILISVSAQVLSRYIQTIFDYFVFVSFPKLRQERSRLRTIESVKLVVNEQFYPEQMEEEELFRMVRRAFSHFGDLQRLSANPLTQLQVIDHRLQQKGNTSDILERANELKLIMFECVQQLKPQKDRSFDTTDEWRFYNSLYFPYIIGIKPYSKRYDHSQLDEDAKKALDWFRTCVPERTFYNWTNAAARLVALQLKDKFLISK